MKKIAILLLAALTAFLSCEKAPQETFDDDSRYQAAVPDNPVEEPVTNSRIVFALEPSYPDGKAHAPTKAVKTAWEDKDIIYVFFSGIAAPRHLKMVYDASVPEWVSTELNGSTVEPMGLSNGDSGTLRAVYLPFGKDVSITADKTSFVFSKKYFTYYLTCTAAYSVENNTVSGTLDMSIPEDYVQFYVSDTTAVSWADSTYYLGTDAVQTVGLVSVTPGSGSSLDLTLDETRHPGGYMYGYAYKKGLLFSGRLSGTYPYPGKYYFSKMHPETNTRADLYVTVASPLASHSAIALPDQISDRWRPMNAADTVHLNIHAPDPDDNNKVKLFTCGIWDACPAGKTKPEGDGLAADFTRNWFGAADLTSANSQLPSLADVTNLATYIQWEPMTVHEKPGLVARGDNRFLFFPVSPTTHEAFYWAQSKNGDDAYHLYLNLDGTHLVSFSAKGQETSHTARMVYKK